MKQLVKDLIWEAERELDKTHKSKMKISDRIAFEKAMVKLEDLKNVLSYCDVTPSSR